jgi:ABC-type amino acid transport substrate-binding protein
MRAAKPSLAGVLALLCAAGVCAPAPSLVLGAEDDAAPWSYADGSGYVNDLVRAAFAEAGWSLQLKVMPYARCKALARAGQLAGCFSASRRPELENELLFPRHPVFQARHLLLARPGATWAGCDPAQWGRRPVVGLVRGYEYVDAVDALAAGGAVKTELAESEISNLRKLQAGRIDLGLVTVDELKRLQLLLAQAQVRGSFTTVCDFGVVPAYVAFSRRHTQGAAAVAAFDEGYAALARRGGVSALQARWRARALDAAAAKKH